MIAAGSPVDGDHERPYLREHGWDTMIYQIVQIIGVAWRGAIGQLQHTLDHAAE